MSCNMCGKCCEAISLRYSKEELSCFKSNLDAIWLIDNWNEITQEEALLINPHLKNWISVHSDKLNFYSCKHYNEAEKKCMIHENKPKICSEYPYYGRRMIRQDESFYSPNCGYNKEELKEIQK